jgi:hypothetical protein
VIEQTTDVFDHSNFVHSKRICHRPLFGQD